MIQKQDEDRERLRQAVMRFRELLDIMRLRLEHGEKAYTALFKNLTPEAGLKEKEMQGLVADMLLSDSTPLQNAALDMRFFARDLERAFEEVHDNALLS